MLLRRTETRWFSGIFEASLKGVQRHLATMWSNAVVEPPLFVSMSSSHETRKAVELAENRQDKEPLPLPILNMVPAAFERNTQSYNQFAAQKMGWNMGLFKGGNLQVREALVPIDVGIGLMFITRSMEEAHVFANLLLAKGSVSGFTLVHPETGSKIGIKIKYDPVINIPTAEFGGDPGDLIKLETTLIVSTYGGQTSLLQLIRKIKLGIGLTHEGMGEFEIEETLSLDKEQPN